MKKVKIRWTCPCCGRKNRWKWPKEDVAEGRITVTCDKCEKDSRARLLWRDEYGVVVWAKEAR